MKALARVFTAVALTAASLLGSAPAPVTAATATTAVPTQLQTTDVMYVLPGARVKVTLPLGNFAAAPTLVRVRFGVNCWDRHHNLVRTYTPFVTYRVPGDPGAPRGRTTLINPSATVTIPKTCVIGWHNPNQVNSTDGWTIKSYDLGDQVGYFLLGKPYNATNFRYNLALRTGINPTDAQAHHDLPQKFRGRFVLLGLNIDDPNYGQWWCSKIGVDDNHSAKAKEYNARWDQFFNTHPAPTLGDVLNFRTHVMKSYRYYPC